MNPGLVVKLRPTGPWRIGPDSGARNRVDVIYHSDSLYSAVTSAMARLGDLDAWLDATARAQATAVCFSSCFPFLDEIGFVIPPRTMWPPTTPSLMAANVRWKSARFVPLRVVQALMAGQPLDKNAWAVDGPSGCLVPAGKPGPFRTNVRWSAAVDRLSGASERHATACIEFRAGAGLWTVVSFADEASRDRWTGPVKAAFRLLADTGFGGERSRGWGRAEHPEFAEGTVTELLVGGRDQGPATAGQGPATGAGGQPVEPEEQGLATGDGGQSVEPEERGPAIGAGGQPVEPAAEVEPTAEVAEAEQLAPPVIEPLAAREIEKGEGESETGASTPAPEAAAVEMVSEGAPPPPTLEPAPEVETAVKEPAPEEEPAPGPRTLVPEGLTAHWLLSLFAPAAADTVDWTRGDYTVLARGGRVESPAGSGELKKQVRMIAEGSVLYAGAPPCGAAADVAPDGFAHPVFRAGFALAIPLPEVR